MTDSHDARNPSDFGDNTSTHMRGASPRKTLWIWRALIFVLPLLVIIGAIGGLIVMSALKPTPEEKEDVVKAIPVLTALAAQDDVSAAHRDKYGAASQRTYHLYVAQIYRGRTL